MNNKIKGEYDFKKDLSKGEEGEEEIIAYMKKKGFNLIERCKNKNYDFKMNYNGHEYSYEIKTDIYRDTGNIAIEIESWGKLSGLSITKADYFVTYFKHQGEIWNISTINLINLINKNIDKMRFVENAGDPGSNTKLFLINKNKFRKHFRIHKIS